MAELRRQFQPSQRSRLGASTQQLTTIRLQMNEELMVYFARFDAIVAELAVNDDFALPKGTHETLLLEGLPPDYETVITVINMSSEVVDETTNRGLLRQYESMIRT
jgi:hypothetical protein